MDTLKFISEFKYTMLLSATNVYNYSLEESGNHLNISLINPAGKLWGKK